MQKESSCQQFGLKNWTFFSWQQPISEIPFECSDQQGQRKESELSNQTLSQKQQKQDIFKDSIEANVFKVNQKLYQDRNSAKYQLRLFLKYQQKYSQPSSFQDQRQSDVTMAYNRICKGSHFKLNLQFSKYIFSDSQFNKENRQIYRAIIRSNQVKMKQLFNNGNVKAKKSYLYSLRVSQLRSLNRQLIQRTQTR